jgi:long-chain acyl-CoA synthetase
MMDYAGRVAQADTYPKLLRLNAREHGGEIALREKDFGLWRVFTWNDYQTRVHDFALGMIELGLGRGDVIGIIGDNRPDWVSAEIATHAIGAMSLGLYRDVLDEEAAYLLSYGEAKLVFAEDEEQVDKLLALTDRVPDLKHIIYSDPRGMRKYDDPRLMEADKLATLGRDRAAREPDLYNRLVDATKGEDVAILCTTSGTTANPKLAMLAAGRVLRHCATYLAFDPKGPDDEYVSVLPLPWIMEQVYALGKGLLCRMKVNFVEQPETMMNDFREIAPTFVLFAPRVWEGIAADVRARVMDSSPLKQSLYELGMKTGLSALAQGKHSVIADKLLFRALRDRLGFTRLRSAATGGAALGPDTFKFFQAMGVPLRTLYGQTELLGAYTLHPFGEVDPDTTGVAMADDIEIRVDNPDIHGVGEIVVRHPNMFLGYYKSPEASAADMKDGWMQSGDAGYFNANKQLVVIDRIKDLAETARGERFSPQYILALHRRNRGAGRRPRRAGGDDLHPLFHHLEMGGEEPDFVHDLYRSGLAAGGVCTAAQGGRDRQCFTSPAAAYLEIPAALQGARCRRRRAHPHPQSPPQRHQREICLDHQRHLWRRARHPHRYRDPLPGRHHPTHPHYPRRGRPRARRGGAGGGGMRGRGLTTTPVIAPSPLVGEGIAAGPRELGRVRGMGSDIAMRRRPPTRLRFAKPPSPTRGVGKRTP